MVRKARMLKDMLFYRCIRQHRLLALWAPADSV